MELEGERSRTVLYDNSAAPVALLAPGKRHDFVVRHDVKELGGHTLVCSSSYTAADGQRRTLPQAFRFTSQNPLVVKTKASACRARRRRAPVLPPSSSAP